MSQIRIIVLASMIALSASFTSAKEASWNDAEACFKLNVGRDRLHCYDQALGRPFENQGLTTEPSTSVQVQGLSAALPYLEAPMQLGSVYISLSQDGVRLSADDQAYDLLDPRSDAEPYLEMVYNTDLDIALKSDPEAGEPAVFLLSCREDITEMRLIWDEHFPGAQRQVDFYAGSNLSERDRFSHVMRVDALGNTLEMPRGLPSIRLVGDLITGPRFQVAVNSPGAAPLFAIFDTSDLRQVLPMQARFCFWSSNTVRE